MICSVTGVLDKKKNTPVVIHSFPVWLPQTQTWMYNQVKQLQEFGVEAHVVCEHTENLDQFLVKGIHSLEDEPVLKQIIDKWLRKFKIHNYMSFLVEVGRNTDTKIIHSHFGNIGWHDLGAVQQLNAKHVVTFYGRDVNMLPVQNPVWRERYRRLFSQVDMVLCEGPHMAGCLGELGCPDNKIKIQHLGVNVENIQFKPRQWREDEPLRVLIAAAFREKKGIPYAIQALKIIADEMPVMLTLIGDAGQEPESKQEKVHIIDALERSGLIKHTRLLGCLSHESMLMEAYDHHLFLQPSITANDGDTEGGAPVSIIEMLATGMPVVATTHCDIPEIVGPELSHLLVPERDIAGLAERINLLLSEPNSWLSLAQEGRKRVESEFHFQSQAEQLIGYYNELV